ncbi:MAG TPA: hypothetical protein VET66_06955 [Steroidobacteraceae bacterium]|nr:hypothetical protein [Steroidobacteraceae bacterium]
MSTNTIFLFLAVGIVLLLAAAIVVVLLASSPKSQKKRMEELHARHMARQPWDAHSAEGRGNR